MFQPEVITPANPAPTSPAGARSEPLHIDCDSCVGQHTSVCDDCIVTFMCDREPGGVVVDVSELRALRRLGEGGLVPGLRHVRRTG